MKMLPTHSSSRPLLLVAALLGAACSLSDAQQSATPTHYVRVTGTIVDSMGDRVPGVTVELGPDSFFSLARRTTGDNGGYNVTSDATFAPASAAPESANVMLRYYPAQGRHRDSLLLQRSVPVRLVPITEPEDPTVEDVEINLP